jgi:glycosyltransferase involved in cell wall biosynthesis
VTSDQSIAAGVPAAASVLELRRHAERIAGALDVLVWCPRLSPGGGIRLLLSLLPGLLRHNAVRSLRLVVAAGACEERTLALLRAEGLAVIELAGQRRNGRQRAQLMVEDGRVIDIRGSDAWRDETVRRLATGCDVVYAPWPHGDPPPDVDLPIVCTYQDTTLIDYPEGIGAEGAGHERAVGEAWLRSSAATVVSSRATARHLDRLFGDIAAGVHVIHHAIRPRPRLLDRDADATPPDGLPPRYVVFAGNTAVHKNLDLLLVAWSRLRAREQWPLVVFGHGTEALCGMRSDANWRAAQLYGLAARLGLGPGNGLHALGYVADSAVAPLIAGAAALIMPSFTEGGGSFPVEEALALGVPVLCSDIPVMREHVGARSATIGWFDPASVDSIGRAVLELVEDHPARRASALAGRADPRPTWDDVAARYAAVFAQVAGRAASRNAAGHAAAT